MKTPWDKLKEKRSANIGFISRGNSFRDPTPSEIARAIMIETESWQFTKGKPLFKISEEYAHPLGAGTNLKNTREFGQSLIKTTEGRNAITAYIETPPGIEIPKEKTWFQKSLEAQYFDLWFLIGFPASLIIIYFVAKTIFFMKGL